MLPPRKFNIAGANRPKPKNKGSSSMSQQFSGVNSLLNFGIHYPEHKHHHWTCKQSFLVLTLQRLHRLTHHGLHILHIIAHVVGSVVGNPREDLGRRGRSYWTCSCWHSGSRRPSPAVAHHVEEFSQRSVGFFDRQNHRWILLAKMAVDIFKVEFGDPKFCIQK